MDKQRIEQTAQGPQVVMSGTPQRTMPATPLRPKRKQVALEDSPLFGQASAEIERRQEELPL